MCPEYCVTYLSGRTQRLAIPGCHIGCHFGCHLLPVEAFARFVQALRSLALVTGRHAQARLAHPPAGELEIPSSFTIDLSTAGASSHLLQRAIYVGGLSLLKMLRSTFHSPFTRVHASTNFPVS